MNQNDKDELNYSKQAFENSESSERHPPQGGSAVPASPIHKLEARMLDVMNLTMENLHMFQNLCRILIEDAKFIQHPKPPTEEEIARHKERIETQHEHMSSSLEWCKRELSKPNFADTWRLTFAAMALQGLLAHGGSDIDGDWAVRQSFTYADAMLREGNVK